MRGLVVAGVIAAACFVAAPASGALVVRDDVDSVDITFIAGDGEANRLVVRQEPGGVRFVDTARGADDDDVHARESPRGVLRRARRDAARRARRRQRRRRRRRGPRPRSSTAEPATIRSWPRVRPGAKATTFCAAPARRPAARRPGRRHDRRRARQRHARRRRRRRPARRRPRERPLCRRRAARAGSRRRSPTRAAGTRSPSAAARERGSPPVSGTGERRGRYVLPGGTVTFAGLDGPLPCVLPKVVGAHPRVRRAALSSRPGSASAW